MVMKKTLALSLLLLASACTNENTDTTVVKNEEPVEVKIEVDTIPPQLDSLMFEGMALNCFFHLGHSTGGEFYFKNAAESVHEVILNILRDKGQNGSDILFLIDKTGSMANDIEDVKKNLNKIIDQVKELKDVRLAVANYGDKNVDGPGWFNSVDLTKDYQQIRNYVNRMKVSDGGDYPESVYDGIAASINDLNWRKNAKKMILVIGDAPSLEDELSDHNRKDILELCSKAGIQANIFPVLVTPYSVDDFIDMSSYSTKMISKIYPNPSSGKFTVELKKAQAYNLTLIDMKGLVVHSESFNDKTIEVNFPESAEDGTYMLRIMDENGEAMNAERIVLKR
jgi:hypothetical protein